MEVGKIRFFQLNVWSCQLLLTPNVCYSYIESKLYIPWLSSVHESKIRALKSSRETHAGSYKNGVESHFLHHCCLCDRALSGYRTRSRVRIRKHVYSQQTIVTLETHLTHDCITRNSLWFLGVVFYLIPSSLLTRPAQSEPNHSNLVKHSYALLAKACVVYATQQRK